MGTMYAALATCFYEPPHLVRVGIPSPGPEQELVDVLAVAVHPQVRDIAAGGCAEQLGDPPLVPGIDAVGRRADGQLVYFLATHDLIGTMAEKAVASARRSVDLPADVDVATVAAAMLPALLDGTPFRELPRVLDRIAAGELRVPTRTAPLTEVEQAWLPEIPGSCLVVVP